MVQEQTYLKVADNSGAKVVQCIKVLDGSKKRIAHVGDEIVVVVKTVKTAAKGEKNKVKKGEVLHAVIVRTKPVFGENAVVLLQKKGEPMGSRITGPVSSILQRQGHVRFVTMASVVL
jgi:large subunit ribosomal protein L14